MRTCSTILIAVIRCLRLWATPAPPTNVEDNIKLETRTTDHNKHIQIG